MKLPAVAIVVAFAVGIATGYWPAIVPLEQFPLFLRVALIAAAALLVFGFVFAQRTASVAGSVSLVAWIALGLAGATLTHQARPTNYVLRLVESGALDVHSPLRWHGRLRDEPTQLPWGVALDIELTAVDFQDAAVPAQGGLRVTYSPHEETAIPSANPVSELPEVHAGDSVAIVAQARLPQVFRDEGAFDRRKYLQDQGVDLTATLRTPESLEREAIARPSLQGSLARAGHRLREEISALLPGAPEEAAVLRAMLLGDRSFLDRAESVNFQKTGVFHVLVVAGLHVGAFAAFVFWLARKFRLSRRWASVTLGLCILAYVAVIEQRPPVLRAALMTGVVLLAMVFYRRVELLNSVAVAALIMLVASPDLLRDSSFQLSFLAMFCIGGIAIPWLERHVEPYARGLRGWRDVTRDVSHEPRIAQFRIDTRSVASWLESKVPSWLAQRVTNFSARCVSLLFRVAEMFVLTLVLQVGMLPLMARDFHRVTLSGPFANLLAVPLTAMLVPLGFATLLAGLIVPQWAALLGAPLRWLTTMLLHAVAWMAGFPRWSYRIPEPPLLLISVFFGATLLLAFVLRPAPAAHWSWLRRIALVFVLTSAALIATHPFAPQWRRGWVELNVLDVGQGDSLFLLSPMGHTILVDGGGRATDPAHPDEFRGPDPGEDAVSSYLWSRGFQKLDTVALTHAHQDHLGGLTAIFENFPVKTLWIGREVASPRQKQLEALAVSKGTNVVHELRGDQVQWDGAQLEFLWPQIVPAEVAPSAKNDDSLVFRVNYGQRTLLLPGDAEKFVEQAILSEDDPTTLRADVLKVGHHGGKNSTTREFLAAIQPRLAVISTGEENPYGHPSPVLLERLQQAGVATLRTDRNGAIHILTDGTQFDVSCFVPCQRVTEALNSSRPQTPDDQKKHEQQ